jgi:hypothetical protein
MDDLKLGWWVATQRRNKTTMPPERRARLNKIGFVWNMPMGLPIAYRPKVRSRTKGAQKDKSKRLRDDLMETHVGR